MSITADGFPVTAHMLIWVMPKRSRKPPEDENQAAKRILDAVTGEGMPEKNPAAVALGRLGGLKGGKARARSLSAKKRQEIARKAAQSRWSRHAAKDA